MRRQGAHCNDPNSWLQCGIAGNPWKEGASLLVLLERLAETEGVLTSSTDMDYGGVSNAKKRLTKIETTGGEDAVTQLSDKSVSVRIGHVGWTPIHPATLSMVLRR